MFTTGPRRRIPYRRRPTRLHHTRRPIRSTRAMGSTWLPQLVVTMVTAFACIGFGLFAINAQVPTIPFPTPGLPPESTVVPDPTTTATPETPVPTPPPVPPAPPAPPAPPIPAQLPNGYAYIDTVGGQPVLVVPCQPVTYHIDQTQTLPGGQAIIDQAITMATQMIGAPTTTGTAANGTGTTITIAYKHEYQDPHLAGSAIGVAHTRSDTFSDNPHIFSAEISLEIEWFETTIGNRTDLATMVVLHEILHANGLAHTDDPTSIMYYSAGVTTPSPADYQAARALNPGCPGR